MLQMPNPTGNRVVPGPDSTGRHHLPLPEQFLKVSRRENHVWLELTVTNSKLNDNAVLFHEKVYYDGAREIPAPGTHRKRDSSCNTLV